MLCRGGASCERDFQQCWFPILSSRSLFPVRASGACACPASFFILLPDGFLVWGSEARCSRAPSPTVCSAGHGRCSRGAWEMRRKNSGSFVAAVLGLLFVGRCGPPQLVSSPKGGGSAAGGFCVFAWASLFVGGWFKGVVARVLPTSTLSRGENFGVGSIWDG